VGEKKLIDTSQAPGLVGYAFMAYLGAFFDLFNLFSLLNTNFSVSANYLISLVVIAIPIAEAVCAFGIANERKVAYQVAVVLAWANLALLLYFETRYNLVLAWANRALLLYFETRYNFGVPLLTLVFDIFMLLFLLHKRSREYVKLWFK
jgi:hypothetical protein